MQSRNRNDYVNLMAIVQNAVHTNIEKWISSISRCDIIVIMASGGSGGGAIGDDGDSNNDNNNKNDKSVALYAYFIANKNKLRLSQSKFYCECTFGIE